MKKYTTTLSLSIFLLLSQAIFCISSVPIVNADQDIPIKFSQDLNLNGTYVYNITQFGGDLNWIGFDWASKYNTTTNSGGQIILNFTGFYNKDPNDIFNLFSSPMPYMDIEFIENNLGALISNHTYYNVSNGEAAFNMLLGYNAFQSGFLIPLDNLTGLKELAIAQDSGYMLGDITVEETPNLIYFDFKQNTGFQNTTLIYDKTTGLLIKALTKTLPFTNPLGYTLEMSLTNYSLDFKTLYTYNVTEFGGDLNWLGFNWASKYNTTTNSGGQIVLNFTGFYDKNPSDIFNLFDSPMAYMDVEFVENKIGVLVSNHTFYNVSNGETAFNLLIGYNSFQSGFLIPQFNDFNSVEALAQANPGEVNIEETDLTLRINYDQVGGFEQKTYLIYEKYSGLLLWVRTGFLNYLLEMTLNGYEAPQAPPSPPNTTIPSFPVYILGMIIGSSILVIIFKNKQRLNLNQ